MLLVASLEQHGEFRGEKNIRFSSWKSWNERKEIDLEIYVFMELYRFFIAGRVAIDLYSNLKTIPSFSYGWRLMEKIDPES
jgi:hypothetical protein